MTDRYTRALIPENADVADAVAAVDAAMSEALRGREGEDA